MVYYIPLSLPPSPCCCQKLRIMDENKYIEEAIARAEEETPYFLNGIPCSLEEENGLGKRLVKATADLVISKQLKSRAQTRSRRREVLSKQGEDKEEVSNHTHKSRYWHFVPYLHSCRFFFFLWSVWLICLSTLCVGMEVAARISEEVSEGGCT
jgi:hypothetical protein